MVNSEEEPKEEEISRQPTSDFYKVRQKGTSRQKLNDQAIDLIAEFVKQILNANGANIGSMMDSGIAKEYRGETDEETIMMAEKFREDYYQQFFDGNNQFDLDPEDDEVPWILRDPDCEVSKYKGRFANLGLSEEEQRDWEEMAEFFGGDYLNR